MYLIKKILFVVFCMVMLFSSKVYAEEISRWHTPILDVYISKDYSNYQLMYDAYNEWCCASNRRFLFNLSSTKGMAKNGHIKVYFNTDGENSIVEIPRSGLNYPEVKINISTVDASGKPYSSEYIYPKMLHYVGLSMGLKESTNPKSVLYKTTNVNQKILIEDIVELCELYGWKVPSRLRYFR